MNTAEILRRVAETTGDPRTALVCFVFWRGGACLRSDLRDFYGGTKTAPFDKYVSDLVYDRVLSENTVERRVYLLPVEGWRLGTLRRAFAECKPEFHFEDGLAEGMAGKGDQPPGGRPPQLPPAASDGNGSAATRVHEYTSKTRNEKTGLTRVPVSAMAVQLAEESGSKGWNWNSQTEVMAHLEVLFTSAGRPEEMKRNAGLWILRWREGRSRLQRAVASAEEEAKRQGKWPDCLPAVVTKWFRSFCEKGQR